VETHGVASVNDVAAGRRQELDAALGQSLLGYLRAEHLSLLQLVPEQHFG